MPLPDAHTRANPPQVLLVAHAQLPRGYSLLQLAKEHLEPAVVRSELGYCLCTYEAAVEHVRCVGASERRADEPE